MLKELLVVLHVLEHLQRDDAVELDRRSRGARLEAAKRLCRALRKGHLAHIARYDIDVRQSLALRILKNMHPLRGRVGDTHDVCPREARRVVQRARAPAAAQVEDGHAVLHISARHHFVKRVNLRLRQEPRRVAGVGVLGELAARVLATRTEADIVEGSCYLVVLLVGRLRVHGDGHALELVHERLGACLAALNARRLPLHLHELLPAKLADCRADEHVGQETRI
mmetsp:Transcript_617/g.1709  ORF Transcript_617/g.1709 Transcript_617/m.1709 type:complete len:225 (+) Transcript_617:563-1237(+)